MEKKNYKEIAKSNKFLANAKEIRDICNKEKIDIGVGLEIYCTNHGIKKGGNEYEEFRDLCREVPLDKIVKEL